MDEDKFGNLPAPVITRRTWWARALAVGRKGKELLA